MFLKKSKIIFLVLIIIAIAIFIWGKYYPVAFVNFHLISAKDFNGYYNSVLNYSQNALNGNEEKLKEPDVLKEIRRSALDKLIEDSLIYKEVKKRAGKDLGAIAMKNIKPILDLSNEKNFEESVRATYGFSFNDNFKINDFKNGILLPQAYREILEGRMNLNNENFNEWFIKVKKESSVLILINGFRWDGVELKLAS